MNDQTTENNYSFCPKCGALMRNGVCPSCANKHDGGVYSAGNIQKNASNMPNMPRVQSNDQNPYLMPDGHVEKKKKGKEKKCFLISEKHKKSAKPKKNGLAS